MKSKIRRLAIIGSLGATLTGLAAGSAQAAVSSTTLPATNVATTSAFLNGIVKTGGAAVLWQFEYGKTTSYGNTTPAQLIPPGKGTVDVLQRVGGLKPGTTYHFRLDVQMGSGVTYYPIVITFGQDRSFTTKKLGRLKLLGTKLSVRRGRASIRLKCASTQTCKGKLTLTKRIKSNNKFDTIILARKLFKLRPGHKATLHAKLTNTALTLLTNAPRHRLGARLNAKLSTGQPKLTKHVTLILK